MSAGFDGKTVFANRGDLTLLTVIQSEALEHGFLLDSPESEVGICSAIFTFGATVGNTSSSEEFRSRVVLSSPPAEDSIVGPNPFPSSTEHSSFSEDSFCQNQVTK